MSSIQQLIQIYSQTNDKQFLSQIISQINTNEKIWAAYSPVTKNHYVDYIKGAATAFIFSQGQYCQDFVQFLATANTKAETMECSVNDRAVMFADMYRSGIELIVVDNGKTLLYMNLSDIAEKPDDSAIPEKQKPVSNPKLLCTANYFFQRFDAKSSTGSIEPVMMKEIRDATYLLPILTDETVKNEKNVQSLCQMKTGNGTMLNIPALQMKNGQNCIPVFTDWIELKRFDTNKLCSGNVITFADIAYFCQYGADVVINPFGFNMRIDKNSVNEIKKSAAAANDNITVFDIETISNEMASALVTQLEKSGVVKTAYLRGVRQNGISGYLVIADTEEGQEQKLSELPRILSQFTGGVPITLVRYNSEFGRQAANGKEPFYRKVIIGSE